MKPVLARPWHEGGAALARSSFGNVRELPSGRFQARYQINGTGASKSAPTTFTTRTEANAWLARERVRLEAEAAGSPKAKPRRLAPYLRDFAAQWVDERPLRPSTRRTYEGYVRLHIAPTRLGGTRIDAITPDDVRAWHRELAPDRPTVRARVYATLKTILRSAVDDELIDANPCRIRGASQATVATDVVVLTPAQVDELADAIGPRFAAAIYLGAYCQLRVGETLALRRRDVDLDRRQVHVRRGVTWVDGAPVFGPPKTRAGVRVVAIPATALPTLRVHQRTRGSADALLFPGSAPAIPPSTQTFSDHVKRAAARAGLPAAFRYHHLRHTGLTLLAEAGASVAELQARAGHSTPHMALRYQHARAERDRDLAARLDNLVDDGRRSSGAG